MAVGEVDRWQGARRGEETLAARRGSARAYLFVAVQDQIMYWLRRFGWKECWTVTLGQHIGLPLQV